MLHSFGHKYTFVKTLLLTFYQSVLCFRVRQDGPQRLKIGMYTLRKEKIFLSKDSISIKLP